ncbi:GxxExxY protein [Marinobacter sp.]|uniref:GxxExxY protein n=1 Tax=Marinobacter sp. TaxID=50741 RepID=UPI00384DF503
MLRDEELTYRIRGCIYEVYRQLGHGFLESVYQKALIAELQARGMGVQEELPVNIFYKGQDVGLFKLDLVVENRVVIELKAQKVLPLGAEAQLINYLKATGIKLGLLANFTYPKASVKRVVLEKS